MRSEIIDAIRDLTLKAQLLLTKEASEQLEGIYGHLPSGKFITISDSAMFSKQPETAETRRLLESLISAEVEAGIAPTFARDKLIREAAFTWLNRLVAFKMMESRKLLRQTISKSQDSNAFKMWLTEPGNDRHLRDFEAGDLPQNGLGEGPRQGAYRRFLLEQCSRLAEEIRVLFDSENVSSRLFPRPLVLRQLIDLLNSESLTEAWEPGNEEAIGWIYQFFIETEKADVYQRMYRKKKKEKAKPEEMPAATQIFTPRWIVRTLVENTLGRMWVQMHSDTRLIDQLKYLVPSAEPLPDLSLKPVRDIRILDPACGTMHFGLVAFDLLHQMYLEEIEKAGQPGWPAQPSIANEAEIPAAILAHNLHGIDIDLRAVQLSALTLYLRAKSINPHAILLQSRLACADIHMLNGDTLDTFLQRSGLTNPIYKRLMSALQERLKNAEVIGSLLRIDQEIHNLVEEERNQYSNKSGQLLIAGLAELQFEDSEAWSRFWDRLKLQLREAFDRFACDQAEVSQQDSFFANETSKGLRLFELLGGTYDIVITNPPYMASRNMPTVLKKYLDTEYKPSKSDLYSAFIERCTEWLASGGRLGMITQQSFMFISYFENLRKLLRKRVAIEVLPHLGPWAFDEVSGEKVNTTMLVFRKESDAARRDGCIGTYFRLVKEPDSTAKRHKYEEALEDLRAKQINPVLFHYKTSDFDAIPAKPWVYWITESLRNLFTRHDALKSVAKPWVGLQTSDNPRFLRYWWEVGISRIGRFCDSAQSFRATNLRWAPHMKGGMERRWYGNQEYVVNWHDDAAEMKAYAQSWQERGTSTRGNEATRDFQYYFRPGITWTHTTSKGLNARIMPPGFICNVEGMACYPATSNDFNLAVLAILNSTIASFVTNQLNPTMHYGAREVGDFPVPVKAAQNNSALHRLVREAIELAEVDSRWDETTYDFVAPPCWPAGVEEVMRCHHRLREIEASIDDEVCSLYNLSAIDIAIVRSDRTDSIDVDNEDDDLDDSENDETSNTEGPLSESDLARRWLSYVIGILLGRFEPGMTEGLGTGEFNSEVSRQLRELASPIGVLADDVDDPDDITSRIVQAFEIIFGSSITRQLIASATGQQGEPRDVLAKYLQRSFFKTHIRQYRRRPVYWLLQSPNKLYGVLIFHEKMTEDTLFRVAGDKFAGGKVKLIQSQLSDLRTRLSNVTNRTERRTIEQRIEELEASLQDVGEFILRIQKIIERGFSPHIDDGILINFAPLWELVPAWQADLKKAWDALGEGDHDWSHQAFENWPQRVRAQCETNKSYAIAHGIDCALTRTKGS